MCGGEELVPAIVPHTGQVSSQLSQRQSSKWCGQGEILADRPVEVYPSGLVEAHQRGCGEQLGDAPNAEPGIGTGHHPPIEIGKSESLVPDGPVADAHRDGEAGDGITYDDLVEKIFASDHTVII